MFRVFHRRRHISAAITPSIEPIHGAYYVRKRLLRQIEEDYARTGVFPPPPKSDE